MSYEQNLRADRSRKRLEEQNARAQQSRDRLEEQNAQAQESRKRLEQQNQHAYDSQIRIETAIRTSNRWLRLLLLTIAVLAVAWAIVNLLRFDQPSHVTVFMLPTGKAVVPPRKVVTYCFLGTHPYESGRSDTCGDDSECADRGWKLTGSQGSHVDGQNLEEVLDALPAEALSLALVFAGHDANRLNRSTQLDSNFDLSSRRAMHAASLLHTGRLRDVPTIPLAVSVPATICAASSTSTPDQTHSEATEHERRRAPVLVLLATEHER